MSKRKAQESAQAQTNTAFRASPSQRALRDEEERAKLLSDIKEGRDKDFETAQRWGGDREVLLALIYHNVQIYSFDSDGTYIVYPPLGIASAELRCDKQVVLAAVAVDADNYVKVISPELKSDKEVALATVTSSGAALGFLPVELRNDAEVVMAAVTSYGQALEYASVALQDDWEVVRSAVDQDGCALRYASLKLQDDKQIALAAICCSGNRRARGFAFDYISSRLRGDKECAMAAVSQKWHQLQNTSVELQSDREVVLAAVTNGGDALEYASLDLRADKEIVLAAVTNDGDALKYASRDLRADKEIVMAAVSQSAFALDKMSDELDIDEDIVLAAVANDYLRAMEWFNVRDEPVFGSLPLVARVMEHYSVDENTTEYAAFTEKLCRFDSVACQLQNLVRDVRRAIGGWSVVDKAVSPVVFADRWIDQLWETDLCISVTFSHASHHILLYCGMDNELQLAREFKSYAPIINSLLPVHGPLPSGRWWLDHVSDFLDRMQASDSENSTSSSSYYSEDDDEQGSL